MAKASKKKAKSKKRPAPPKVIAPLPTDIPVAVQPIILVKICRLCESKDGPFLNIFGSDIDLAKKIEELLPVVINEYDELPHKICFRCSARVADLHEFSVKCMQTQTNLYKNIGKKEPPPAKSRLFKVRKAWEEKLVKSKMSNEDYCDILVQQAMEGVTPIPTPPTPEKTNEVKEPKEDPNREKPPIQKAIKQISNDTTQGNDDMNYEMPVKPFKVVLNRFKPLDKYVKKLAKRLKRSQLRDESVSETKESSSRPSRRSKVKDDTTNIIAQEVKNTAVIEPPEPKIELNEPIINIPTENVEVWKHITSTKVANIGYIYTCELCKRNFLKKNIVNEHRCQPTANKPEKEILYDVKSDDSSNFEKDKKDTTEEVLEETNTIKSTQRKNPKRKEIDVETKTQASKQQQKSTAQIMQEALPDSDDEVLCVSVTQSKKKPGPACKTIKPAQDIAQIPVIATIPGAPPPSVIMPSNFPGRKAAGTTCYKLVPGPNNTFTLETIPVSNEETIDDPPLQPKPQTPPPPIPAPKVEPTGRRRAAKNSAPVVKQTAVQTLQEAEVAQVNVERKISIEKTEESPNTRKRKLTAAERKQHPDDVVNTIIELEDEEEPLKKVQATKQKNTLKPTFQKSVPKGTPTFEQSHLSSHKGMNNTPYPVGLVSRVNDTASTSNLQSKSKPTYTVVQTDNPSKLLISSVKNMAPDRVTSPVNKSKVMKKRGRKTKNRREQISPPSPVVENQEDYAMVDEARYEYSMVDEPEHAHQQLIENDPFFTFINLDPLLKPSYVLPTSSIIQESQITTSTPADSKQDETIWMCEICDMPFDREKKLESHIRTHYAKDEADEDWNPSKKTSGKKKSKKAI